MLVAVVALAVLLLSLTLVARRKKPARRPVVVSGENVVSLDAYRGRRLDGRRAHPGADPLSLQYPLTASGGGFPTSPGGGLRTCRQPDGRLGRPSHIESV